MPRRLLFGIAHTTPRTGRGRPDRSAIAGGLLRVCSIEQNARPKVDNVAVEGWRSGAREGVNMTATPHLHSATTTELTRVLQSAVILSWDDLMPPATAGSIHIEYGTGTTGVVDYLKVFSSTTRGCWNLVCEYWVRSLWEHPAGMSFGDIPCPRRFAQAIEELMQHQGEFTGLCASRDGMIQISPPTADERKQALSCITEAFDHLGYPPADRQIAV